MQKRAQQRREAGPLRNYQLHSQCPQMRLLKHKNVWENSLLKPDVLTHWSGPENIAWVEINGESSLAFMDSGSTINSVTPEFIWVHSLDIVPLSDLSVGTLGVNGFGGIYTQPLGYVIIRFQMEGVRGYDKDQVALVEPDSTTFGSHIPVILGTPTINRTIDVIKEIKIDELSTSLNGSRIAQLLSCHKAELAVKSNATVPPTGDPTNLNKVVKTTKREEIDTFSSKIIHGQTTTLLLGSNMHVKTQTLQGGDGPNSTCLMDWAWWTCTPKWLQGANKWQ